jgi:uncharacterized membrane protein YdbT with pleckstrin-like domain
MQIAPDRRWITKQWLVYATITLTAVLAAGIAHLVVALAAPDQAEAATAMGIVWLSVGGAVVLMWAIAVPIVILWYRNLEYLIEEDKVIVRKGILTKTQHNIPFEMVTDFRLQRTLYDRALGIGSILVQTAGQSTNPTGYEGKLAGLDDWDDLHEDLRRRLRRERATPTGGADAGALDELLDEVRRIRRTLEASR